jgi:hypothetical protein
LLLVSAAYEDGNDASRLRAARETASPLRRDKTAQAHPSFRAAAMNV